MMRVNVGSKIRNLMGYAMKKITEDDTAQICWCGSGAAVSKAVSCAEIQKRKIKGLHQITDIRYKRVIEYWDPVTDDRLDRLKVNRDVPCVYILLSKQPFEQPHPGYQPPGPFEAFWQKTTAEKPRVGSATGSSVQHKRSADMSSTQQPGTGRRRRNKGGQKKIAPNSGQMQNPQICTERLMSGGDNASSANNSINKAGNVTPSVQVKTRDEAQSSSVGQNKSVTDGAKNQKRRKKGQSQNRSSAHMENS